MTNPLRMPRPVLTALIESDLRRIRAEAAKLPLFGPTGWSGTRGLAHWDWQDKSLSHGGLAFGHPMSDGPWLEIVTTVGSAAEYLVGRRVAVAMEASPPPDSATYAEIREAAAAPAPDRAEIVVDGAPRDLQVWPDVPLGHERGRGWYGLLDGTPGVVIISSGLDPRELRLEKIADIEPYIDGQRQRNRP